MKATSNQARAVRSYLKAIGHPITHVQALEVIARGQGYRSRHVKPTVSSAPTSGPDEGAVRDRLANALALLLEDVENGVDCGMPFEHSDNNFHQSVMTARAALALLKEEQQPANAASAPNGSAVEKLVLKYGESGEHPDYPRGDWLFQAGTLRTHQPYWDWVALRLESVEEDTPPDSSDMAEAIKAEYLASRCEAFDVSQAVNRLMQACPSLFKTDREAWEFINEEAHEERSDVRYLIQMESDLYGVEDFSYDSEKERREGLIRLMARAVELNDGVQRKYYFAAMDSDIEEHSPAYYDALHNRESAGRITEAGEVFFEGQRIGCIADITADGLTLYSWIDDTP